MRIGIGIDTGGTCTDAVAFDFDTETLLAKGKTLTTRENLSLGIGRALDQLPPELIRDAALISLSTTLATNACVENKGGRAKLLVFGLTDEMLTRYGAESKYGFNRNSVRCIDTHGSADGLITDEPDWDSVVSELDGWLKDADALSSAELYSGANGAPCEKRAETLARDRYGLQCVNASELSGELDVLARGATALLNARLFPIGREFIEAALSDFKARDCKAPVMVVRSDGSFMSAERTLIRPVETILSGPAASVLAGRSFSSENDCLIIDMGGTTTDVSVIHRGNPIMADGGIQIGGWRTHVKGVLVDTFALGGDSAIRADGGALKLNARRVMPLCAASSRWGTIAPALYDLLNRKHVNQFPLHEFLYLVREPSDANRYDADELRLIDALRDGPVMLEQIGKKAGLDLYHLDCERLEAEGIVMRCGLTPTDFMHIRGDYNEYDAEASRLAARYLLCCMERSDTPDELSAITDEAYELVQGYMYENLLRIMLAQQYPSQFGNGLDAQMQKLIRDAWKNRRQDGGALFRHMFGTDASLVGVGAPTHIFLPEVARAMNAKCVLPEDAEVANALGALKANIVSVIKADITQMLSSTGAIVYIAHMPTGSQVFPNFDEASTAAMAAAELAAVNEARSRGALGKLNINTRIERSGAVSNWGSRVQLGGYAVSEVTARFL